MPGFLMHVNMAMQCFHGGPATVAGLPRVLVNGQPVATMASQIAVAGCLFQVPIGTGTKPQPCVTIKWTMPSTRFLIAGQPAALLPSLGTGPGVCQSVEQIPQGAPLVTAVQPRVVGS